MNGYNRWISYYRGLLLLFKHNIILYDTCNKELMP